MRVLIASKYTHLGSHPIGGVQTWNCAVGDELERRGHEVVYWERGLFTLKWEFDLGIFANLAYTEGAVRLCKRVVKVSHGIIPDEQGGPGFYAVSEEVATKWGCDRGIIRQPVNLDFWSPGGVPEYLVRHSYRNGLPCLTHIAAKRGWALRHLVSLGASDVLENLRKARVVIATGRAAVEAMAVGVPVVIADCRRYQGPLLALDPFRQMSRNYSGRGGTEPTPELMEQAIDEAIARGSLRAHAEQHHDVRKVVEVFGC